MNNFKITKTVEDKQLVFGWASVAETKDGSPLIDWQEDIIEPDELEKAAYDYVLNFRNTGEDHDPNKRRKGRLIESMVFTKDKQQALGIAPGTVPVGWFVGFHIDDLETWEKVKKGDFLMFSIEGKGERVPTQKKLTFNDFYTA